MTKIFLQPFNVIEILNLKGIVHPKNENVVIIYSCFLKTCMISFLLQNPFAHFWTPCTDFHYIYKKMKHIVKNKYKYTTNTFTY